ncbi:YpmA family protein [Alicyclobacillus dauci]|uniref:YpmA family protein n=1 Tax=Alicyclobacillus dauci TaxID=1475485 RepID=A0ABY6YZL5_9BACL|nr:YpmA family protein [Alicyclobacillus dauci]WAH35150.1 YpmA family protein [Alicyclobacillus dauci]
MEKGLNVIATHQCSKTEDLYLLVDFLNRNLKDKDIVFGLSKSDEHPEKMQITLYRTDTR